MGWQSHYPPDEPLERAMTPAQILLLRRVVATNGGGLNAYREPDRVIAGLINRHMVQGMSGRSDRIVHTRRGLDWVRAHPAVAER